jgi:hypothetical protein
VGGRVHQSHGCVLCGVWVCGRASGRVGEGRGPAGGASILAGRSHKISERKKGLKLLTGRGLQLAQGLAPE